MVTSGPYSTEAESEIIVSDEPNCPECGSKLHFSSSGETSITYVYSCTKCDYSDVEYAEGL